MCANDCKDSVIYRISHLGMHSGTLTAVETAVVSLSPRVYTKTGKAKIGDGSGIRFGAGGIRKPAKLKLETAVVSGSLQEVHENQQS